MKTLIQKDFTIGEYGSAQVKVDSMLNLEANVGVKVDIIKELEALSAKTKTPIDDNVVSGLKTFLAAANAVLVAEAAPQQLDAAAPVV